MSKLDFSKLNIATYGDIMLDEYYCGTSDRLSPESPVPVVLLREIKDTLGGAGNVANNIVALGAKTTMYGIVGDDQYATRVVKLLNRVGISFVGYCEQGKPTVVKTRIISNNNHQLLRVDRENKFTMDISEKTLDADVSGIVISDYAKGTITARTISKIVEHAKELKIPTFFDPKHTLYPGITVLKLNMQQARSMTGEQSLVDCAKALKTKCGAQYVVITCSGDGIFGFDDKDDTIMMSATRKDVFDVSGAGDTVMAALALCMCNKMSFKKSLHIANVAAGIVVSKHGTATCTAQEIERAMQKQSDSKHFAKSKRGSKR